MICVDVYLLGFILFGTLCASCTWISVSFFRVMKFSAIISSSTFLIPLSLSSPSGTLIMHLLAYFIFLQRSHMLLPFFFFFSVVLTGWFPLFYLPDHLCILLCHLSGYSLLLEYFFISKIELSIFDWVIFIVSRSLLKWSVFISVLFLNSVSIFITKFLNSVSHRLSLTHLFFQGFSLALSIGSSSFAFSFYLTFSLSMNLGTTVIFCGLEVAFLCGTVPI